MAHGSELFSHSLSHQLLLLRESTSHHPPSHQATDLGVRGNYKSPTAAPG